jgi:hypothetical protein
MNAAVIIQFLLVWEALSGELITQGSRDRFRCAQQRRQKIALRGLLGRPGGMGRYVQSSDDLSGFVEDRGRQGNQAEFEFAIGYYERDNAFHKAWDAIARNRDAFVAWVRKHILETKDFNGFLRSRQDEAHVAA